MTIREKMGISLVFLCFSGFSGFLSWVFKKIPRNSQFPWNWEFCKNYWFSLVSWDFFCFSSFSKKSQFPIPWTNSQEIPRKPRKNCIWKIGKPGPSPWSKKTCFSGFSGFLWFFWGFPWFPNLFQKYSQNCQTCSQNLLGKIKKNKVFEGPSVRPVPRLARRLVRRLARERRIRKAVKKNERIHDYQVLD